MKNSWVILAWVDGKPREIRRFNSGDWEKNFQSLKNRIPKDYSIEDATTWDRIKNKTE